MNINIYADERIADAGPPHTRARVLRPSARARVCECAIGRPRTRADACERLPAGVDRGWLGAQAFLSASKFNANIGAWNTASVATLESVCAAFGPAARHRRRTLGRCPMRRGRVCVRRVCVCTNTCSPTRLHVLQRIHDVYVCAHAQLCVGLAGCDAADAV